MAIQYFLTDVGRDIALNATSLGLNVSLSHIGVGTAKYDPLTELDRTALVAEVERYPLNGGGVEPNSHTLRFVTSIEPTITVDGFEIGIFTDTGALFAIASTTGNDPLIRLVANIVSITTFGMLLSTIDIANLIISIDPNTPISVALMNEHLSHPDPHPQYVLKTEILPHLKSLADLIYHVGSCHGSYSMDYDPSVALEPILGYPTIWRLSPGIPEGVPNLSSALSTVNFIASDGNKKTRTLRIWRRMPDDYVDPTFKWERISPAMIEGNFGLYDIYAQFKLTTTGVAPGTQFAWEVINDPNGYIYLSSARFDMPGATQLPKKGVITVRQDGTAYLSFVPHYSKEAYNHYQSGELHHLDIQLETGDIASQGIFLPTGSGISVSMSKLNNQQFLLEINRDGGRALPVKVVFLSGLQYIILPENQILYTGSSMTVNLAPEFIIHPGNIPQNAMISGKFIVQEPKYNGTYQEIGFSCYVK